MTNKKNSFLRNMLVYALIAIVVIGVLELVRRSFVAVDAPFEPRIDQVLNISDAEMEEYEALNAKSQIGVEERTEAIDIEITEVEQPKLAAANTAPMQRYEEAEIASLDSQDASSPIFVSVEKMPSFPGDVMAMEQFIRDNMEYPISAQENGIQGRVTLRFVVRETGEITDLRVLRGVDPACDKEALRVVKAMPKWNPGVRDGKLVPVHYTLPIIFRLKY